MVSFTQTSNAKPMILYFILTIGFIKKNCSMDFESESYLSQNTTRSLLNIVANNATSVESNPTLNSMIFSKRLVYVWIQFDSQEMCHAFNLLGTFSLLMSAVFSNITMFFLALNLRMGFPIYDIFSSCFFSSFFFFIFFLWCKINRF